MKRREEYARAELLLGAEGMVRLIQSSVIVFGVGGVGSHCIEALAEAEWEIYHSGFGQSIHD